MDKAFRLLSTSTQQKIEEHGFSIILMSDGKYEFGKYTSYGHDFWFQIDIGDNKKDFANNILEYYNNFDPSQEAYYWIDETGHGCNGAPYEMCDVYNDMLECKRFIYELYKIIKEMSL